MGAGGSLKVYAVGVLAKIWSNPFSSPASIKRMLTGITSVMFASASLVACSPTLPPGDGAVTIYGPYFGLEADAFQAELDSFSKSSGVRAIYKPIADMDSQIQSDASNSTLPDVAIWDNPRPLLAHSEQMVPLDQLVDIEAIRKTLVPGWDQVAMSGDKSFGLPTSSNIKTGVKSLVFYNPQAFERLGYKVPSTNRELEVLIERIKSEGSGYPWCAGIESGGATGWVATDWIEQYVLSNEGPENYNKWISGALKFDSAEISKAAEKVSTLLLQPGNVSGGGAGMARENFGKTEALFSSGGKSAGQCFMMRQGLFITDFFPDDIKAEISRSDFSHANAFALPPADGGKRAVLGDGYLASAFSQDSDVAKVLSFILSDSFGTTMVKTTNFLSPHKTFPVDQYRDVLSRIAAETLKNAEVFGFDASTAMPEAVSRQFWISSTKWINESLTWTTVASEIDSAFDR